MLQHLQHVMYNNTKVRNVTYSKQTLIGYFLDHQRFSWFVSILFIVDR